jgi:hypothetical protein
MLGYNKNISLSLIVVTPLFLNIGIDKYADLPPTFIATQLHVAVRCRTNIRLSNKNIYIGKPKYKTHNFTHIRTVHLDIIKVSFINQLMHK